MKFYSTYRSASISIALVAALAVPAFAQNSTPQTADEIRALLETQKTRGLVLAPNAAALAATSAAVDAGDTTAVKAAAEEYTDLPQDLQVNVQISFDFDSAALRDDQKAKLVVFCEVLQSMDEGTFNIVGHTDASGTATYNQGLSLLRAKEVKRHLVDDCGVDSSRLTASGVGESFPFDKADPNADANRRVEFQAAS